MPDVAHIDQMMVDGFEDVWILVASITMMELWFLRNGICLEDEKVDMGKLKKRIIQYTKDCAVRIKSFTWDCSYDFMVFKKIELKSQPIKLQRIVEVRFHLPAINQTLICCDGASRGNPGVASNGFVCRSDQGEFLYAEAKGLGIATNFIAEIMAIIEAAEWALQDSKYNLCINSDSNAAVKAYISRKLPWIIQARWSRIKEILWSIRFVHSLREINFTADALAKKGAGLERG